MDVSQDLVSKIFTIIPHTVATGGNKRGNARPLFVFDIKQKWALISANLTWYKYFMAKIYDLSFGGFDFQYVRWRWAVVCLPDQQHLGRARGGACSARRPTQ